MKEPTMSDTFEFTELRMRAPWDNLMAAISIIQAEILAGDSLLNPELMFWVHRSKSAGLETAVALLAALTGEVEDLHWHQSTP